MKSFTDKSYIFMHLQNVKTPVGQFENGRFVWKGSQFSFCWRNLKSVRAGNPCKYNNCTTFSSDNSITIKA